MADFSGNGVVAITKIWEEELQVEGEGCIHSPHFSACDSVPSMSDDVHTKPFTSYVLQLTLNIILDAISHFAESTLFS